MSGIGGGGNGGPGKSGPRPGSGPSNTRRRRSQLIKRRKILFQRRLMNLKLP